jgi:alkylhydroperoxidase family enzyme
VVSDETYNALKSYCSDEEIIEITYIAASENYLNRLIKPLGIGSDELCKVR